MDVTAERLAEYRERTVEALSQAEEEAHGGEATVILDMVRRYLDDAAYFADNGDVVTSFAAINYAHGWLDCGARLGYFDVDDDALFTVDA